MKPMPEYGRARLYCDMDGVVADFDGFYRECFGKSRERHTDWADVRSIPNFYRKLPLMRDAPLLWAFIKPYRPIMLTGTPMSIDLAANDKVDWVSDTLGDSVPVICCKAKRKSLYCRPGDYIIDDTEEYRHLWEEAGGNWIQHVSAVDTIAQLMAKGFN